MKFKRFFIILSLFLSLLQAKAQDVEPGYMYKKTDGTILMAAYISDAGDTVLYCQLREFEVSAPRTFANADDFKRYERYQRYAPTVIHYAVDAVRTYRELEAVTRDGGNRDRKKYINDLQNKMDDKLKSQLKDLTRTQGLMLIKMIEKELHMPFYDLVKDVKGGFAAFYWNEFGKVYGYQLKDGYERGKDYILDSVLDKYDLSYYLYTK